ncbi:TolC family protein [Luteibaculum oceani]|nr:TolC family protein [Luteibaculum oceani]
MYKFPILMAILMLPSLLNAQDQPGIKIEKQSTLTEEQRKMLADSLMVDKMVTTRTPLLIDEPLEEQLLPKDSLIEIAIRNNPDIDVQQKRAEIEWANVKHEKVQWTRNIYGTGFYFQGSQNALVTSTFDANATSSLSNGARYGLTVQLPLYDVVGRKRKIKMAKLAHEAEQLKMDQTQRSVRQEVLIGYNQLISAQKLFFIATEGLQNSNMNLENARNQFESGLITINEFSRILEIQYRMRVDYENARAQFYQSYYQFEIIMGTELVNLVNRR